MPSLAGGDVFRRDRGQQLRIWGDADAAEIKSVGVEADGEGGFGLGRAAVVDLAGGDEEIHAGVIELEVAGLAEIKGELCAARAVLGIAKFVFTVGVVEEGEETDDFLIGRMMAGEVEAVAADGAPVRRAVVGMLT